MQEEEAQKKAKELWGEHAFVELSECHHHGTHYYVGETSGPFQQLYGGGDSWEEAFKAAHFNLN